MMGKMYDVDQFFQWEQRQGAQVTIAVGQEKHTLYASGARAILPSGFLGAPRTTPPPTDPVALLTARRTFAEAMAQAYRDAGNPDEADYWTKQADDLLTQLRATEHRRHREQLRDITTGGTNDGTAEVESQPEGPEQGPAGPEPCGIAARRGSAVAEAAPAGKAGRR